MNKPSLFELSALSRAMPTPAASSVQPGNKLVRRKPSPLALEQRFMFDGAADVGDYSGASDSAGSFGGGGGG